MAGGDAAARSGRALCAELRSLRLIPRLQMTSSGGVIYAFKVPLFSCPLAAFGGRIGGGSKQETDESRLGFFYNPDR